MLFLVTSLNWPLTTLARFLFFGDDISGGGLGHSQVTQFPECLLSWQEVHKLLNSWFSIVNLFLIQGCLSQVSTWKRY